MPPGAFGELRGTGGTDGVTRLDARLNDRQHTIAAFDTNRHGHLLRY
jgi:hypothetical protein